CVAIGVDCAAIGVEALRWALRHSAKKTATSPKDAPIAEMLRQARIHQSAPIAEMLRQALIHQDIPSDDPIELHQAQSPSNGAPPQEEALYADDPLFDVLHQALANRTGKLRVSDAYLICGIEAAKARTDQILRFRHAIRTLGWRRQSQYLNGSRQYVYVRGTEAERQVALVVEYDPHLRSV